MLANYNRAASFLFIFFSNFRFYEADQITSQSLITEETNESYIWTTELGKKIFE